MFECAEGFKLNSNSWYATERNKFFCVLEQVHGTGDFEQCSAIIAELLLQKRLPANQEASFFGGTTVSEIGSLLPLTTPMYMVGDAIVQPVLRFKALGLMPVESGRLSADFHVSRRQTFRIGISDNS